jgi:hypothetical protein
VRFHWEMRAPSAVDSLQTSVAAGAVDEADDAAVVDDRRCSRNRELPSTTG